MEGGFEAGSATEEQAGTEGPSSGTALVVRTSAVVGLFLIVTNLLLLGVAIVSARQLGPNGRGVLVLVIAIGSVTGILAGMGTHVSARIRLVSPVDPIPMSDFIGLSCALAGVEFALSGVAAGVVLPLTHVLASPAVILLTAWYGCALLLATQLGQGLYGIGRGPAAASSESAGTLLQLAGLTALGLNGDDHVLHYVVVMACGETMQAAIILLVLARVTSPLRVTASIRRWRELVLLGLPALFIGVSQGLSLRLDRFLTGVFLTPSAVGTYSVAATITEGLWLVPIALAQVLFHQSASQTIDSYAVKRLRWYSLILTSILAVALFFGAPPIIRLALGSSYAPAVAPLRILLLGAVGMASYYVDSMLLMGRGRVRAAGAAAATGMLLIAVADWALIPTFGISGAAWASAFGYLAMGAVTRLTVDRLAWHSPRHPKTPTISTARQDPR